MTRVSENSHSASMNFSINQAKAKLEDLQIKGANLKRIVKPSDDPIGNIELMQIRSNKIENDQFKRNSSFALTALEYTENSLKELTEIMMKAKEIAVAQSSDLFNPEIRKSVAKEVSQLKKQVFGIANRRLGNRYIFSGFKTLQQPFSTNGKYHGDTGVISLEVLKNFYIPTNIPGKEVFISATSSKIGNDNPLENLDLFSNKDNNSEDAKLQNPDLILQTVDNPPSNSLFNLLETLENALNTDNPDSVQELLNEIDDFTDQLITLRTRVGSNINTLLNSEGTLEETELFNASRKNKIEDADIAELFSDLNKQNQLLRATYKTTSKLINENLLDFLK